MEEENRFFICLNSFYKDRGRWTVGFGEKGPWQLNSYMSRCCVKSKGCIIHTRQQKFVENKKETTKLATAREQKEI
jgi:hypothetical protein